MANVRITYLQLATHTETGTHSKTADNRRTIKLYLYEGYAAAQALLHTTAVKCAMPKNCIAYF